MEKVRNSNFELMRIVSMFFIVLWHVIMHGNVLSNCMNPAIKIMLEIIMFCIIIHVNSFIVLSGYFQSKSKFKLSKLIKIFLQVVFYSFTILLLAVKLGWIQDYTIVTLINNVLLSSLNNYWFIKVYLVMYIFSDYMNKFIDRLTQNEYKSFLIISFIVLSIIPFLTGNKVVFNDGYTIINFIFLYMIGGYLRRYPLKETYHFKNMSINGYRMFLLFGFFSLAGINFLINHFALEINGMSHIFSEISARIGLSYFQYSTPFAMIQTVFYFEFFRTLKLQNKFINKISNCAFGIYLIHDNEIIRMHIYKILKIDNGVFSSYKIFPKIILVSIGIFIICSIMECIRKHIATRISNLNISKRIITKTRNFMNSFNFNINW